MHGLFQPVPQKTMPPAQPSGLRLLCWPITLWTHHCGRRNARLWSGTICHLRRWSCSRAAHALLPLPLCAGLKMRICWPRFLWPRPVGARGLAVCFCGMSCKGGTDCGLMLTAPTPAQWRFTKIWVLCLWVKASAATPGSRKSPCCGPRPHCRYDEIFRICEHNRVPYKAVNAAHDNPPQGVESPSRREPS